MENPVYYESTVPTVIMHKMRFIQPKCYKTMLLIRKGKWRSSSFPLSSERFKRVAFVYISNQIKPWHKFTISCQLSKSYETSDWWKILFIQYLNQCLYNHKLSLLCTILSFFKQTCCIIVIFPSLTQSVSVCYDVKIWPFIICRVLKP